MSENSTIEWCDHTWNPWEGCQKVSPGCDNCYAESRNARFSGGSPVNWGPGMPRRRTSQSNWRKPLRWNAAHAAFMAVHGRRQRVFCASLADVFDLDVPLGWFIDFLDVCRQTPSLDKLLLTKRIGNVSKRLAEAFNRLFAQPDSDSNPLVPWLATWIAGNPPPDIWLGATIVNQAEAERDIPKLLKVPAKLRFLSMEPLLGTVDVFSKITGELLHSSGNDYAPGAIDWVIVGGESGTRARPMHPVWATDLRDQCMAAGVPFFFKQHGAWEPATTDTRACVYPMAAVALDGRMVGDGWDADGHPAAASNEDSWAMMHRVGKKAAGRLLNGVLHDAFPVSSADVSAACRRILLREPE
ncbi:phage Gp37/Gp68 family protein [Cupriavidus numazuensis]|uniref:Uncharacterized protein n=1 Tax=Cupriavidus numazuensis TaxID=221992 RepID=A0ABM8TTE5_9BURK|nr:phage Gp37/Gp68 family protein [Cupriavidus numazuensis]CAG2159728.1 hypothetical protein LMG26411_06932 [Cupriavidus numazuensis]